MFYTEFRFNSIGSFLLMAGECFLILSQATGFKNNFTEALVEKVLKNGSMGLGRGIKGASVEGDAF